MSIEGDNIVLSPGGHIDSVSAGALDSAIREAAQAHPGKAMVLDFGRVTYISSAGLRVLLSASKRLGGALTVRGVSPEVYEIFSVTGFTELLRVERGLREIDVEGCEVIGVGAMGTVYRIDPDTIVKVYNAPDALDMIRNEQRRAKQAFLKGVPTAISYDAVRVGERYGSMFELVKAQTFNDLLVAHPEDEAAIVRQYAGVIRQVHAIEAEPGELPDCRDIFLGYLDALGDALPPALSARLRALFRAMPEDLHLIHGDFHMKNLMLSEGEPLLIDMDTLSAGNPVFDFAGIYVAYMAFNELEPDNSMVFLNIPASTCERIWERTLDLCLDAPDEAAFREKARRIQIVALVRFLYLIVVLGLGTEALRDIRVRGSLARLEALVEGVEGLAV